MISFCVYFQVIDADPDPVCTLLEYLRTKLKLCGTKLGCGEGNSTFS